MITFPSLPSLPSFSSLPTMPSVDFSSLQLPSFHLPKFDLPKVELPKVELPTIDTARLQPVVDGVRAAIERNTATVSTAAERAVDVTRDGAYAALGLGVVATQRLVKAAKQATEKATAAVGSVTTR